MYKMPKQSICTNEATAALYLQVNADSSRARGVLMSIYQRHMPWGRDIKHAVHSALVGSNDTKVHIAAYFGQKLLEKRSETYYQTTWDPASGDQNVFGIAVLQQDGKFLCHIPGINRVFPLRFQSAPVSLSVGGSVSVKQLI